MSDDRCPHGIDLGWTTVAARRYRMLCPQCEQAEAEKGREVDAANAFRARVVQTARAVLPAVTPAQSDDARLAIVAHAFDLAEAFERAADAYLKDGGGK